MATRQPPRAVADRQSVGDRLPVRAVQRAFDLLARVGTEPAGATLSALARDTALPVSTVARLLATLEAGGFVRREADGRYRPGGRLVQIGVASLRGSPLYDLAEPHLRRLAQASGETANLGVRVDATHATYLRQAVGPHSLHHAAWLGRPMPLDRTAVGEALLGRVPAGRTIVRRDTLEEGVTAIATPVLGPEGDVVAALSVTGPSFRIGRRETIRIAALLTDEAARIGAALGAPQQAA